MSADRSRRLPITDIPDSDGDGEYEYFIWYFYYSMSGPLKAIAVTAGFFHPDQITDSEYNACRWEAFTDGEDAFQRASKLFHLFNAQIESKHPELQGITAECDRCGHSSAT